MISIKVPTKDIAYVKTGGIFGSSSVCIDRLCVGVWGIHKLTPINLQVFKISIINHGQNAFMAKDAFVDIDVAFTIKIRSDKESILKANESYGNSTFTLNKNENIISQLTGVIRNTVASHTISELQSDRKKISEDIDLAIKDLLDKNGLSLQNVSVETLKQTDPSTLLSNDVFTAKTKAMTAGEIELRKKEENDAIRDNELSIMRKNVEVDKAKYELEKERSNAAIEVEKQKIEFESQRQIKIAQTQALQEEESNRALIDKDIAIQKKKAEMLKIQEITFKAQEEANLAETSAITAKLKAEAEREKQVGIIKTQQEMEQEKLRITIPAEAELEKAKKDAEAIKILAEAEKIKGEIEAKNKELMNDAENKLSAEIIKFKIQNITVPELAKIIEAMYKPFEKVQSFNILQAPGLIGGGQGTSNDNSSNNSSLPNQIIDALQRNKMVSPMVDSFIKSAGFDINNVDKSLENIMNSTNKQSEEN